MKDKIKEYRKRFYNGGFTLVELLAVIVILAIIMLIAIPAVLNTLTAAKRKSFVEYVDKIFLITQKQVVEEETMGNPVVGCKTYYIKKDLGLTSTGNYDGFVLVKNDGFNDIAYYITLHDDEYKVESYLYDGSLDTENLEYYNSEEELDNMLACASAGCSSCSMDGDVSATEICSSITQVNDSNPGSFAGSGTQNDPYKLESIEDLVALSKGTNDGSLEKNKYYKLMVDLSFACDKSYVDPSGTSFGDINGDGITASIKEELTSSLGWVPIGNKDYPFSSTIIGNNKKIYGLYINSGDKYKATAFIGYASNDNNNKFIDDISFLDASVNASGQYTSIVFAYGNFNAKNAEMNNIKSSGNLVCKSSYCGSIIASLENIIVEEIQTGEHSFTQRTYNGETKMSNFINKGNVKNSEGYTTGGAIGNVYYSILDNVYNYGNVDGGSSSGGAIGSINNSKVNKVYNYGNFSCTKANCGGTIGEVYSTEGGTIYNYGKVTGFGNTYFGGVIGHISSNDRLGYIFSNVYNYGDVTATNNYIGGCVGKLFHASLYNAYNYKNVEYTGDSSAYIGGVVGDVNSSSELHNAGNYGTVKSSGYNTLGGISGTSSGTITNVYNYGKVIRDSNNQNNDIRVGGLVGYGSCYNCYSIADIDIVNGSYNIDYDRIGLAFGATYSYNDIYNVYTVGTITNKAPKNKWYHYYGGLFGDFTAGDKVKQENYYSKVSLIGFPKVGVLAGSNNYYNYNGSKGLATNMYVDMYTDASEINDNYNNATSEFYKNYYANLNNSPNKQPFKLAQEYDFSQVNGMWFRDTLKLGNNWKYEDEYYPKLYKVLPNGSVSSELVEGQKDIPIK